MKFKKKWILCSRNKITADCLFSLINTKQTFLISLSCFEFQTEWVSILKSTINHLTEGRQRAWVGNEQTYMVGELWQRNLKKHTIIAAWETYTKAVISVYILVSFLLNGKSRKTSRWNDDHTHFKRPWLPPFLTLHWSQNLGGWIQRKHNLQISVFKLWKFTWFLKEKYVCLEEDEPTWVQCKDIVCLII